MDDGANAAAEAEKAMMLASVNFILSLYYVGSDGSLLGKERYK